MKKLKLDFQTLNPLKGVTPNLYHSVDGEKLNHFRFADDIVFIAGKVD